MIGRFDARLNNESVLSLSDDLYIMDVVENAPDKDVQTANIGYANGTRLLRKRRKSLSVTIHLMLKEYATIQRSDLYDRLCAWAKPGYLEINNRIEKRLYVDDVTLPSIGSVVEWTGTVSLVLTAYSIPYWENVHRSVCSVSEPAEDGTLKLYAPGNADECQMYARIMAGNSPINYVYIHTGTTTMEFENVGLAAGKTLEITHSNYGLIVIDTAGKSAMAKRTAQSDDDLMIVPGKNNLITFETDAPAYVSFGTRGRWL